MTAFRSLDPARFDALRALPITWRGESHVLDLRIPHTKSLNWTVAPASGHTPRFDAATRTRLFGDVVGGIDGGPFVTLDPDELAADNQIFADVIRGRNALYESLRVQGSLYTTCPACGREHERDIGVLALALNTNLPPLLAADGIFLNVPKLADPWPIGSRLSEIAPCSKLRFELPSARFALSTSQTVAFGGGVLGDLPPSPSVSGEPELAAWRAHERKALGWTAANATFRAELRLSVALQTLGELGAVTPDVVERLPLVDFAFLDLVYFLTHNVDVPAGHGASQPCPDCGTPYMPVR